MQIVGHASCPVGYYAGHDGDECRASLLDDGKIKCVHCGTIYPKFSPEMRRVWCAICTTGFHAPSVTLGSQIQRGTTEYDAACLSGYDPAQSDRVQAKFTRDGQVVRLDYEQSNQDEIKSPDRSLHRDLTHEELELLPPRIKDCVDALLNLGFSLRHFGPMELGGARIYMTCGRPVGSMGYVIGVSAELTWPVK